MANRTSPSSDSSTSASFDLSSPPSCSLRKKKGGSLSRDDGLKKKKQQSVSSDTDYNWDSKPSRKKTHVSSRTKKTHVSSWTKKTHVSSWTKEMHVSSWTKEKAEGFGLFYEKVASRFTDFYDLFYSCKGKSRYGFIYPLSGEDKKLLDSLVEQTDELIKKYGVEMETGWEWTVAADWPFVWTKCRDAVRVLNEIGRPSVYSGNHMRCYAALVNFYKALKDYVQEEMWRSSSSTQSDVPEGTYTELCSKFFEIFFLTSRRGEFRKSVMMIKDIPTSSSPDLRLTLSTSSPPSLFVVEVVELIFTCLKITTKHYQYIHDFGEDVVIKGMEVDDSSGLIKSLSDDEDEKGENKNYEKTRQHQEKKTSASTDSTMEKDLRKSGTIFYTKPYNYLISKDRKDLMEFLFWIGINCEKITVSSI